MFRRQELMFHAKLQGPTILKGYISKVNRAKAIEVPASLPPLVEVPASPLLSRLVPVIYPEPPYYSKGPSYKGKGQASRDNSSRVKGRANRRSIPSSSPSFPPFGSKLIEITQFQSHSLFALSTQRQRHRQLTFTLQKTLLTQNRSTNPRYRQHP